MMQTQFIQTTVQTTQCTICKSFTEDGKYISLNGKYIGNICISCEQKHTAKEILVMSMLFNEYGGYFGQEKDSTFSVDDAFKPLLEKLDKGGGMYADEINYVVLHKAILCGIPLQKAFDENFKEVRGRIYLKSLFS